MELRIEAGAFEGRPVLFNVTTAASLESLAGDPQPSRPTASQLVLGSLQPVLILLLVILATRLTRRNLGQGRADRRGALRFGLVLFGFYVVSSTLGSHALTTNEATNEIWPILIGAIFMAVVGWSMYFGGRTGGTPGVAHHVRLLEPPAEPAEGALA